MAKKNAVFAAVSLVAVWLIWVIAYFIIGNDGILPSFWEAFREAGRLLGEAAFWRAFGNTLWRSLVAFIVSFALGVVLAVPAHFKSWVRAFFAPVISILRTVPTMAVALLLFLWTSREAAPVIVAALVLFPAAYAAALAALDEAGEEYGFLTRAFRVGVWRKIFCMYLPLAAPSLLKQAGSLLSLGLKVVISGEVLVFTAGSLGGMMQDARIVPEMSRLMALTLLTVLLGFALEGLCRLAYFCIVRWRR